MRGEGGEDVVGSVDDAIAELTAPGARFETQMVEVQGVATRVFSNRLGSLRELARLAADKRSDDELLVHGDRRYTYRDFFESANSASLHLTRDYGLAHGDRVAILSANNPEWALTFWGAINVGAIAVALNGWWKTDEVVYGLNDSGARFLLADRPRFERIREHLEQLDGLEAVFLVDPQPGALALDDRMRDAADLFVEPTADFPGMPIDEDDAAVILYTSGTTGRPKGAVGTHRSWIASTHNLSGVAAVTALGAPGDRAPSTKSGVRLLCVPLFHVSGAQSHLVAGLLAGWKLIIPEGRFDPEQVLGLIQTEGVTAWAAVPTMVSRVCQHPDVGDFDLSSVTSVGYGGAPAPTDLLDAVQSTFPNLTYQSNIYGLTETSGVATINGGQSRLDRPTSVGRPMLTVDVEIRDDEGRPVALGETGEVCVRGPLVIAGYWNQPEATAEAIVDGWLRTGDVGYLGADGHLHITDRAKDVIIRGGENVYCVAIEDRLVAHPDVLEAAVFGVAHPDLGEEVRAVVQMADVAEVTQADLQAWTAEKLADFNVPTRIDVGVDPLPRNETGKVLKDQLRAAAQSEVSS